MKEWLLRFWRENRLTILVVAILIASYLFLRTSPSDVTSAEELVADLRRGEPTLVLFYTNT